jgi:CheY-like chemotaxis protein
MICWPSFYYPTTAIFVDDNKRFLTALGHRLPNNIPVILFDNPVQALELILSQNNDELKSRNNITFIEQEYNESDYQLDNANQLLIGLRYDYLAKVYDSQRFSTMSVLIVDQLMPELDGISFCDKLKMHPIKKIMLTANSDFALAVEAFNSGIIDYYLSKEAPNLIDQLVQTIQILQKSFFNSEIERSVGSLLNSNSLINDISSLPFYEEIKHKLRATEYYLLDKLGSMLFITCEGIPVTLALSTSNMLDVFSKIAEDQDQFSIASILSKREQLLFFPRQEDHMRPASEWNNFLNYAKPFPGKDNIFYSLIYPFEKQPINLNNIQTQLKKTTL